MAEDTVLNGTWVYYHGSQVHYHGYARVIGSAPPFVAMYPQDTIRYVLQFSPDPSNALFNVRPESFDVVSEDEDV